MFLCPNNNPRYEATQECFDRYPLLVSETRSVRYFIPNEAEKQGTFTYRVSKGFTAFRIGFTYIRWKIFTGQTAARRNLFAMRNPMDLFYWKYVGNLFKWNWSRRLWQSRNIQKLRWHQHLQQHGLRSPASIRRKQKSFPSLLQRSPCRSIQQRFSFDCSVSDFKRLVS